MQDRHTYRRLGDKIRAAFATQELDTQQECFNDFVETQKENHDMARRNHHQAQLRQKTIRKNLRGEVFTQDDKVIVFCHAHLKKGT